MPLFPYALLGSSLASQIVLIDANKYRAEGEAIDLTHRTLTHSTKIWAGDYSDCTGAVITVITTSTAQRDGKRRQDLGQRNFAVYQSIIPQVVKANPDGILLIASNPLDVLLTYAAMKLSRFTFKSSYWFRHHPRYSAFPLLTQPARRRGSSQCACLYHWGAR